MATVGDAAAETRENIPLQNGRKARNLCSCDEEYLNGSKFFYFAFGGLTAIITVALMLQIYHGDYQIVPHGSVATDSLECSKIGTKILKNGGNAVDAAIASAFCLAVVAPHLTSLDGEGQMMIYNHRKRKVPEVIYFGNLNSETRKTLPRMVVGMAYIHEQYGTVPWNELMQPAAELASQGFLIPKTLVQAITAAKVEDLYGHQEPGQILQLQTLANTLQQLAAIPENELYEHVRATGSPLRSPALKFNFNGYNVYVPNESSTGPLFLSNLEELQSFNFTARDSLKSEYIYRVAELTQNFYEDRNITSAYHEGTSTNLAVMDLDDNYVSLTIGLSALFGAREITTGGYIIDVRQQPSPSSRLPIIITDSRAICGRRLVLGASDIALATQLTMAVLIANENVTDAVEAPRFHLLNNGSIAIEDAHTPSFSEDVLQYLKTLTAKLVSMPEPYMSSNFVEKVRDDLNSHSDSRGGGIASRF